MKRFSSFFLMPVLFLAAVSITSCNKTGETDTGSIDFGMNPLLEEVLKSAASQHYDVTAALVTIVGADGQQVYEKEYLPFYSFGESYVTKSLKLDVGRYRLTEFLLVDTAGTVTWATPLEGSRLAHLVDDPLPIGFSVAANTTTHVHPQVVRVANNNPDDFGYVNFNVEFVDNFCINVFLESHCYGPMYDSLRMEADFRMPYYQSRIAIYSEGVFLTQEYLVEGENRVMVPRGYDVYNIRVFDCLNQVCFREMFGLQELLKFRCAAGEMLFIQCGPNHPDIIITPEDINKPTIEQGVFGKITSTYPDSMVYWVDPNGVDTVWMGDYEVFPMVADLYIYKTDMADTIYYPVMPPDCYYYPDMNIQPLAIVRSNSSGLYQLPMEEGKYSYLLKTPYGFYIDSWVSSHVPGRFAVIAGEVTILNIHFQPCAWY